MHLHKKPLIHVISGFFSSIVSCRRSISMRFLMIGDCIEREFFKCLTHQPPRFTSSLPRHNWSSGCCSVERAGAAVPLKSHAHQPFMRLNTARHGMAWHGHMARFRFQVTGQAGVQNQTALKRHSQITNNDYRQFKETVFKIDGFRPLFSLTICNVRTK